MNLSALLSVSVDFDTSHLVFPSILAVILALLLLLMLFRRVLGEAATDLPAESTVEPDKQPEKTDLFRLSGTLILTVLYFLGMQFISDHFPNLGFGFLFASMPFMFTLSLLYMHERTINRILVALINAVLCPLIVWFILYWVFNLSLP